MEMFLMGLCLSMIGVAVSALAFGAATRHERQAEPELQVMPVTARKGALGSPRFFSAEAAGAAHHLSVPPEVLLLQLEQHVRLEQAAAESFLYRPSIESLHSRTSSSLMH